ncbi:recombination-associated protein RdgC [Sodalis-like endosymbiont of Proechinophthirus fluctus]|uniref:recombination-associated protein RdgC n=1 Tax=Sodalis-like endosymbiont of Proechinophthirus fluctus TaxID=1462730 RepID=UPI000B17FCA4|nr:recombination-associated protein RdgC [Sodalis-like endosymbiont of Proechinophthirus fluctus]
MNRPVELLVEQIKQQLSDFIPCGSQDMEKSNWVPSMGAKSDVLTRAISEYVLLCLHHKEEKF